MAGSRESSAGVWGVGRVCNSAGEWRGGEDEVKDLKRRHFRPGLLLASWVGIFVIAMAVDVMAPKTAIGGLVRFPFMASVGPAAMLTGYYFTLGPRHARRHWLTMRFVLANWNRAQVIVDRKTPNRVRTPRPPKSPFWWAEERRKTK